MQELMRDDEDDADATDEELAQARPFAEAFPDSLAVMRRSRGRPRLERPKQKVTLRLSADVVDHFRGTGPGWQTRIDKVLADAIAAEPDT